MRRYAVVAALLAVAIGSLVLLAWWGGGRRLAFFAGLPTMVPLTALILVLAGIGLLGLSLDGRGLFGALARAAAALAGALAALVLVEYATGVSLGIDLGAAGLRAGNVLPFPAGRPAPQTAVAATCLGPAILLRASGSRAARAAAEILALAAATTPTFVLLGYAFGVPLLVDVAGLVPFTGMALPTASATLLLATGTLAARPDLGATSLVAADDLGGMAARRLLLGVVALIPVSTALMCGARIGWYPVPVASALVVVTAVLGGIFGVLATSRRIERLRRDSEAAIRDGERRFRELFELAEEAILVADPEGRWSDANPAACRMLRRTHGEIVGHPIGRCVVPEQVPRLDDALDSVLSGEVHRGEWDAALVDGSRVPVEVCAKLLPDGRWLAVARDISERRAAQEREQAHRREVEELLDAFSKVTEAAADLPHTGLAPVLRTIAEQARRLIGVSHAAIGVGSDPTRPFDTFVAVGAGTSTLDAIGRTPRPVGTLGIPAVEGRVVRTDAVRDHPAFLGFPAGHPELHALLGVPVMYRERPIGNVYLAETRTDHVFSAHDEHLVRLLAARTASVLELARLHEVEVTARSRVEHILAQLPDGVVLLDDEGRIVQLNDTARALARSDWTPVDAGVPPFELRRADGTPVGSEERPGWRAAVHHEVVPPTELTVVAPGGRTLPVLVSAAPLRGGGAVSVFHDVTTLKQLERLREEWTAVVAHDLRQPITGIGLAADLLVRRADELPGDLRPVAERIGASVQRLRRMVSDLLDVSRIESRRLTVNRAPHDVTALVRDAAARASHEAPDRELVVRAPGPVEANVDPQRIQQVLDNLLSNAQKYGRSGSRIEIVVDARGDEVEIAITNEGAGIPAAELPRLFDRFARTAAARASNVPGIGLGLYICKGIVEAHGGRITVESTPGEETTFRVTLPRDRSGA